jgi:hypothetical protein
VFDHAGAPSHTGDSQLLGVEGSGVVRVQVDKQVVDSGLAGEKELSRLHRLLSDASLAPLPSANGDYVRTTHSWSH